MVRVRQPPPRADQPPGGSCLVLSMQPRTRASLVLLSATLAGCDVPVDDVPHADPNARTVPAGNYPDPVTDLCGALPEGVAVGDGLASAHALTGPRTPSYADTAVDPATVRLRLSSWELTPAQLPPPIDDGFTPRDALDGGWLFALDLAPTILAPGVYPLSQIPAGLVESWEGECDGDVCGGGGGGGGPTVLAAGEIELFRVDAHCVVGEIRGSDPAELPGVRNGGFIAERIALDCLPVLGEDCDGT